MTNGGSAGTSVATSSAAPGTVIFRVTLPSVAVIHLNNSAMCVGVMVGTISTLSVTRWRISALTLPPQPNAKTFRFGAKGVECSRVRFRTHGLIPRNARLAPGCWETGR